MAEQMSASQRKSKLTADLREAHATGDGAFDDALSQRELGARYGLSGRTVSLLLQQLENEGVLYTVPRVGTFLGRRPCEISAPYVFVTPMARQMSSYAVQLHAGFEERIAQLGGVSIGLTANEFSWHCEQLNLTSIAGVFLYEIPNRHSEELIAQANTHVVHFGETIPSSSIRLAVDSIAFDHTGGGAEATRHLLSMGHRKIAFLALHGKRHEVETFAWSQQREAGWRNMMLRAGQSVRKLAFHPAATGDIALDAQVKSGMEAAAGLIETPGITAVVAVNVFAAQGLLEALRLAAVPKERWPAIVCFDSAPIGDVSSISYLRHAWAKVGAEAAQVLWDRKNGRLTGEPHHRLVNLQLIPRLTCRADWAASGLAHRQAVWTGEEAWQETAGGASRLAGT